MAFNVIPIGGDDGESDAGGSDDEDDLVQYKLKQKVACCNSIIRAIRTIGAPCFNSSAVTEKNHIGVNHALLASVQGEEQDGELASTGHPTRIPSNA